MHNSADFVGKFCCVVEIPQSYKSVWMEPWFLSCTLNYL